MKSFNLSTIHEECSFLYHQVLPYKGKFFLFLVASLFTSVFDGISIGLLIPIVSFWQGGQTSDQLPGIVKALTQFFQSFSTTQPMLLFVGFVVAAIFLKNAFFVMAFRMGEQLSNRVTADMRLKAMKLLLTVGIDFHHKSKVGELIEKTINYTQWMRELTSSSVQFIVFLITALVLFLLMLMLSWQLTLFSLLLGITAMILMTLYMKQLSQLGHRCAETSRELTHAVQENLSAVPLIKSYGKEKRQIAYLKKKIESYMHADNTLAFRSYSVQPITECLGVLIIGLLLLGSLYFSPSESNFAQLLPFLYIIIRIVTTLKILNDSRGVIQARWPFLRQMRDLLRTDNKPFIPDGGRIFPGLEKEITFNSVTFSYHNNENYALRDIDLRIPRGKTTAVVGKSGAGKSTLIHLLLRFYDPQQGVLQMDGQALPGFQTVTYRQKIGIVNQDTFIFNETVGANIAFGGDEVNEEQIVEAAKKAGAHEFILQMPDGYDSILGDNGARLSGGQKQRISIARAILKDPEILILDEATSSLDTITVRNIHKAITDLSRDRTVIIIAHRLTTIENADHVIVLKNGRVAEFGNPATLLENEGEYYRLISSSNNENDVHG